jgi:hypothetical protein
MNEQERLDYSIAGWLNQIEGADNKNTKYWQGMTELEYCIAKVVDRLLIKYNQNPPYPEPRTPVFIRLRYDE